MGLDRPWGLSQAEYRWLLDTGAPLLAEQCSRLAAYGLPQSLDDALQLALAKKPKERFQNMAAFRGAFEAAVRSGTELGVGATTATSLQLALGIVGGAFGGWVGPLSLGVEQEYVQPPAVEDEFDDGLAVRLAKPEPRAQRARAEGRSVLRRSRPAPAGAFDRPAAGGPPAGPAHTSRPPARRRPAPG